MSNYNINIGIKTIGAAAASISIKELAAAFVTLSDKAAQIQAKMNVVGGSVGGAGVAMENVRRIAAETRTPLEDVASSYQRVMTAAKATGASQGQVSRTVENLNKLLKVNGASASEASAVMTQFSQALQKGYLDGEEFKSMSENLGPALDLIAAKIAGVDSGPKFDKVRAGLKKMGSEGKLTSDILIDSFSDVNSKGIQKLQKDFEKLPVTFEEAKTSVVNKATDLAGAFGKGLGLQNVWKFFTEGGEGSMKDLIASAEDMGTKIKNYVIFIADGFKPIVDMAKWAWDAVDGIAVPIIKGIVGSLGLIFDFFIDLPTRAKNAFMEMKHYWDKIWGNISWDAKFNPDVLPSVARAQNNARDLAANQRNRNANAAAVDAARPGAMGDNALRKPPAQDSNGGRAQARTDAQAYRDFLKELAKEGYKVNEAALQGYRTTAQQAGLYRKYGPGNAAAPGRSNHEFYKGVDLPTNADPAKIEAAAARAGVRLTGSLKHGAGAGGMHRHQNFEKIDGQGGDSWEDDQIEKAEKYEEKLQELKRTKEELALTDRERAALDNLAAAGLERNLNATDAMSRAIIEQSNALHDAQAQKQFNLDYDKKLNDQMWDNLQVQGELAQALGDGAMQWTLMQVAAIRALHLRREEIDLMRDWTTATEEEKQKRQDLIDLAEEQYQKEMKLIEARKQRMFNDELKSLNREKRDLNFGLDNQWMNPEDKELAERLQQLEDNRNDYLEKVAEEFGKNSEQYTVLAGIADENFRLQKELITREAEAEKFRSTVGELQNLFQGLFTDARGTMKQFFQELITKLLTAIAYALIFKTTMANGLQMSGGGGGLIGNILGTFLTSLAGGMGGGIGGAGGGGGTPMFTPSNPGVGFAIGGTMRKGHQYMINEKGQELFMPGVDGRMITNRQLKGAMGGTNLSLGTTNITVNNSGTMDEKALALHVASAQERQMRNLIREEMRK